MFQPGDKVNVHCRNGFPIAAGVVVSLEPTRAWATVKVDGYRNPVKYPFMRLTPRTEQQEQQ